MNRSKNFIHRRFQRLSSNCQRSLLLSLTHAHALSQRHARFAIRRNLLDIISAIAIHFAYRNRQPNVYKLPLSELSKYTKQRNSGSTCATILQLL